MRHTILYSEPSNPARQLAFYILIQAINQSGKVIVIQIGEDVQVMIDNQEIAPLPAHMGPHLLQTFTDIADVLRWPGRKTITNKQFSTEYEGLTHIWSLSTDDLTSQIKITLLRAYPSLHIPPEQ